MHGHRNLKLANAQQAREIFQFKTLKQLLHKTTAAIWFNETCRAKQLTPTYISIKINGNILNNHLHLDKRYNTINSNTLANELVNLKINSRHRLLTLDIKDLYVNIPIQETLNLTRTQLNAHNDKQTTHQIMTLLSTILRQKYLSFLGQIYQPIKASPWARKYRAPWLK